MTSDRLIAGRYRLGDPIGTGAMGVVWRASDVRLRRTVAVKQLLLAPGLTRSQALEAKMRAMREGRIAARLHHQNAVTVFDVAEEDGQPWLVMEFVDAPSLAALMREKGPLEPQEVARIGAKVAAALAAAHEAGIVHRDVKPANVLVAAKGTVKITDFGISRAIGDVTVTSTGFLAGTPAYLSPEIARGENPEPSSDVFALGSTLYAAVEGTPPFGEGDNPLAVLHSVAAARISAPRRAGALGPVLMQLLAAEPADRPVMREAQEALEAVAEGRTPPVVPPSTKVSRAEGTAVDAAAATTVLAAGAIGAGIADGPTVHVATAGSGGGTAAAPVRPVSSNTKADNGNRRLLAAAAAGALAVLIVVGLVLIVVRASGGGHSSAAPPAAPAPAAGAQAAAGTTPSTTVPARAPAGTPAPAGGSPAPGAPSPAAQQAAPPNPVAPNPGPPNPAPAAPLPQLPAPPGPAPAAQSPAPPAPPPPSPAPSSAVPPPAPANLSSFIAGYYSMLPGNTDGAWSLLSSSYQAQTGGYQQYASFWSTIAAVQVSGVTQNGSDSASATLSYTLRNGSVTSETRWFRVDMSTGRMLITGSGA